MMTVTVDGKTFEVCSGSWLYSEEKDLFIDWNELGGEQVNKLLNFQESVKYMIEDCF